jgi:hypothetical protein
MTELSPEVREALEMLGSINPYNDWTGAADEYEGERKKAQELVLAALIRGAEAEAAAKRAIFLLGSIGLMSSGDKKLEAIEAIGLAAHVLNEAVK